ncbi:hypothetical protein HYH02_003661 [Chlamydomonas schloesseri]|uniref:tRNA/rRNA methyltransferase SpoU type domain-containing protein n=1 Tax=Chlamydomonas schloesseri TaxID=2026947 RepID=A0A835WQR1_9CHLO|nr:hypothetical protein HYH02_003661 [Chlamydomonas schloesseri]|eukprot:KAG2451886.1 hypothetical protein HYH02_003661 [Chlamydomonas schloesseri]
MKNFGLHDLRVVRPRDGWPNPAAVATSSHAADLLEAARLYDSVEAAIADLDRVYAATARTRFMHKPFVTSKQVAGDICSGLVPAALAAAAAAAAAGDTDADAAAAAARSPRAGLMFGRESSGLTNEEVALANKVLTIEANPVYPVLNLAQAIVCVSYELFHARAYGTEGTDAAAGAASTLPAASSPPLPSTTGLGGDRGSAGNQQPASTSGAIAAASPSAAAASVGSAGPAVASSAEELRRRAAGAAAQQQLQPAPRGELDNFVRRLVGALDESGFFESADKRPATELSIRNLAAKVEGLTRGEVALLHGMLSKLTAASEATAARRRADKAARAEAAAAAAVVAEAVGGRGGDAGATAAADGR